MDLKYTCRFFYSGTKKIIFLKYRKNGFRKKISRLAFFFINSYIFISKAQISFYENA